MHATNAAIGESYYTHVSKKDVEGIKQYLHPEVEFSGPLASLKGRDAVVAATNSFMEAFRSLTIKYKFASDDQSLMIYEVDLPGVAADFAGASLLTIRDGKIVKIQLFYDGSRAEEKKEEIFSKR